MLYAKVGGIRNPVKQEITLEFCRSQNKDICILGETHIGHEQIHQIRNNWLGPIFFAPGETFSKGMVICFTKALMISWMLTQIQKRGLCPSKFVPLMTEFFVSMLLQVIVTENNWLGDASLKVYKLIWKAKLSEMETRDFNCTLDKTDRDEGNKTQIRYRCHSNLPCLNSSRIMGWRICGEGRTQISLSSPNTIGPPAQDPRLTGFILVKKLEKIPK